MNVARLLPPVEGLLPVWALWALSCSDPDPFRDARKEQLSPPESRDAVPSRPPARPRPGAPHAGAATDANAQDGGLVDAAAPGDAQSEDASAEAAPLEDAARDVGTDATDLSTTYRFDVRVHVANTRMDRGALARVLTETQLIWDSQARICFEFHTVGHDEELPAGFDVWYVPELPDLPDFNGYIEGRRIVVRDQPKLSPALDPVSYPASRTTAHELGHGLGLEHYTDPGDLSESLMASKQAGYRLHDFEIEIARRVARTFGIPEAADYRCAPIRDERDRRGEPTR